MTTRNPDEKVWQVKSERYTGGIVTVNGKVTEAAPVLKWALGKGLRDLMAYFDRHCIEMIPVYPNETASDFVAGSEEKIYEGDPNDL